MTHPPRERAGGTAVLAVVAMLLVLVGGGYAAAYGYAGDTLPRDTEIAGVDVGGLDRADAVATLERALAPRLEQPIAVRADGRTRELTPEQLGLGIDVEASVDAAVRGRSWRPDDLWEHYAGRVRTDPVVSLDRSRLEQKIGRAHV